MGRFILVFLTVLIVQNGAWAIHSTPEEAAAVRRLIEKQPVPRGFQPLFLSAPESPEDITIKLPVSAPKSQGTSGLCWTFAAQNILETRDLVVDPTSIETFSKGAMQYWTWTDRYSRYIENGEVYGLTEGGTVIDAFNLMLNDGLYNLKDVPKFVESYWSNFDSTKKAVDRAKTNEEKKKIAQKAINRRFYVPPAKTHWKGQEIDPKALAKLVLGDTTYVSYWHSNTEVPRWGDHPDGDARPGTMSWYLPRSIPFSVVIRKALEKGYPIEVSINRHSIVVYGATYNVQGLTTKYFIKDSEGAAFYEAEPKMLDPRVWQATTVKLDELFPN